MSLLSLEAVCKRYGQAREQVVLREVNLQLDAGQLAVVWGMRRSGRSTLLRLAAGLERPDSGTVRFDGTDLASAGERLLGARLGYCQRAMRFTEGSTTLEHTMVALLSRWVSPKSAKQRALVALERTGAAHCAKMRPTALSASESMRVSLARTLTLQPSVIVIDEPTKGVELSERDEILTLLRSIADEGTTILASTGDSTGFAEADLALVLGAGELRSATREQASPGSATVVPLHRDGLQRATG